MVTFQMEYQTHCVFCEEKLFFYHQYQCKINDFTNSLEFSCIYRKIEIQATNNNFSELFYSEHHDNIYYVHGMFE